MVSVREEGDARDENRRSTPSSAEGDISMPVQVSYPGVYVQEIPSGVVSITGVATSVALFIGMSQRGPMNTPTLVLSRTSYESQFGADSSLGEMSDQVRQFFLNGGSQAYIMRIAVGSQPANVELKNEFDQAVFVFEAKDDGKLGEAIRLLIDYETSQPETTFNLTAYRDVVGVGGQIQQAELETFKELSTDPNSGNYVVTMLESSSKLLRARPSAALVPLINGFALAGTLGSGASAGAADTALFTAVNTAIADAITRAGPGTTAGRFEISVDGQPFTPVALTAPITLFSDIETTINTALNPLNVQVTVDSVQIDAGPPVLNALRIQSQATTANSSVQLRRVASLDDIAVELQLGTDNGGLEVSGASVRRPMPNGIPARYGTAPNDFGALGGLFNAVRSNVPGIVLTDSSGPIPSPLFGLPAGAMTICDPVGGAPSFGAAATALDAIVQALNAGFAAAPPPRRWTAVRSGYRIVFKSTLTVPDFGPGATIATLNFIGTDYDFSAANSYLGSPPPRATVHAYRPGASVGPFIASSQAGLNGTAPLAPAPYDDAYTIIRRDVDLFNILVLPRNNLQTDDIRATFWGPASAFCTERRAVLLIDPRSDWQDVNQVKAGLPSIRSGIVKDHSGLYWPRVTITDPVTGATRPIDPAGTVAGIYARIDTNRGVWKAPAGLEAATIGVSALDRRMSDDENGVINPQAVNALRAFASGIVVWGARTMDGFDNSGDTDYRYMPVRRTALFIEESLYRGLKFAVFEPNDEPLWARIRLAAGAFMNGLFRQGAFQGAKTSDAYFVKCDSETTTQTDINLGIVNVLVGFAPLRPAEFIVLTLQQKAGQVQT
jgi:phage tail sheath protein FI